MSGIAIITDDPGWHGKRLVEALSAQGFDGRFLSLTDCRFDLDGSSHPLSMPGFEREMPAGVFVRGVPGGTMEQVVFWLGILHALKIQGIPVYNDAPAIERTVDKGMTSFLLGRAGLPTPPAWVCSHPEQAIAIARRELEQGRSIVSKPLFGSQGKGLRRYDTLDDLADFSADNGLFYLQRFVPTGGQYHDFRVFVIAGRSVAAMRRNGQTWLNNVHQGARCEPVGLEDRDLCGLAEDAANVLGMNYAGVDIIRNEQGLPSILEVNSIPAWKGLQGVTRFSIAVELVDDFLKHCRSARPCLRQAS